MFAVVVHQGRTIYHQINMISTLGNSKEALGDYTVTSLSLKYHEQSAKKADSKVKFALQTAYF